MGLPRHAHRTSRGSETVLGNRRTHDPPHGVYRLSQRARKRVEEVFGWMKTVGGGRKLRYSGVFRHQMWAELTVAGYNLGH